MGGQGIWMEEWERRWEGRGIGKELRLQGKNFLCFCCGLLTSEMGIIQYNITVIIMIYSKESSWRECCQHEQEIAILQEKLMDIHNKLIDQLDICKEQELTIIELNKKLNDNQGHRNTAFDTFKYQSFGQHSHADSFKQNETPNYKIHYNHDSRESVQTKTELLQADLEAMRSKVLTEITEKNKLKEDIKEMKSNHRKELSQQSKRLEGLETMLRKIQDENEQLRDKYDRARREYRSESELEKLVNKLGDIETRYHKEKQSNRELTQENIQLVEKIDELEKQLFRFEKQYKSKEKKLIYHDENVNQLRDFEQTKPQPPRTNKNAQYRDMQLQREPRDRGERVDQKRKKRGFQQTKQLIKKLEEAEINMRKNRKQ